MSSVHSLQLSDVAIGGSTVFLKAGISVAPTKVRAWFFFLLCNQTSTLVYQNFGARVHYVREGE